MLGPCVSSTSHFRCPVCRAAVRPFRGPPLLSFLPSFPPLPIALRNAATSEVTFKARGVALLPHPHLQIASRVFNDAQQGSRPAYRERQRHLYGLAGHPCCCCALSDAGRLLDSSHRAPTPYLHPRLWTSCPSSLHHCRTLGRLHDDNVVPPSNCQKPLGAAKIHQQTAPLFVPCVSCAVLGHGHSATCRIGASHRPVRISDWSASALSLFCLRACVFAGTPCSTP